MPFSDYAFNKAHTAAYGLVSYWTAYLKAHYPQEYMAALLTSVKDDKDKSAIYLNECRRMKIQVLPPDVNESDATFTPVGGDIRFGLTAIRNVGANVVDKIVEARQEQGRFTDFNDFMAKVPALVCNKRVIESLVKGGAFDEMGHGRRALVAIHEQAVDQYVETKRNEAIGQDSLFGGLDDEDSGFGMAIAVPEIDEWDKMTLLGHEREMLGLYVSDHPLLGLEHVLAGASDCSIGQLMLDEERPDGSPITVTGLITSVQRKITKKGDTWAVVTVEDLDGAIDVLLFPGTYQLAGSLLAEDAIVTVRGKLSRSKDQPEIRGEEVTVPDLTDDRTGPVVVSMPITRCTPPVVDQLKEVLRTHPGVSEVHLRLLGRERTTVMRVDDRLRVAAGAAAVRRPQAAPRPRVPEPMSDDAEPPRRLRRSVLLAVAVVAGLRRRGRRRRRGLGVALEPADPGGPAAPALLHRLRLAAPGLHRHRPLRPRVRRGERPDGPGGRPPDPPPRAARSSRRSSLGSLAAAYTMHAVGVALGPPDPAQLAATAADGTHMSAQLVVNGKTPYLVWPMVSLFVLSLVFFAWPGPVRWPRRARHVDRTRRSGRDGGRRRGRLPRHAPHGADITGSTTMSEQQPPVGTPEYLDSGQRVRAARRELRPDEAPAGRRSRRTAWLVGGGVVGLLALGAGAWAALSFFQQGAQPAEALPSTTVAYASIDLDPSGSQKIDAFRTLEQVPGVQGQGRHPQRRRRPPEARATS